MPEIVHGVFSAEDLQELYKRDKKNLRNGMWRESLSLIS